MAPSKIIIIRHAEKPDKYDDPVGLDEAGNPDKEGLTAKGWERAAALPRLFEAPIRDGLAVPSYLFASKVTPESPSERPYFTLRPLSQKLGLSISQSYTKDEVSGLAADVSASEDIVMISWEHKMIAPLLAEINPSIVPVDWPDDRFDLIWVLNPVTRGWHLSQLPQLLLPGDQQV